MVSSGFLFQRDNFRLSLSFSSWVLVCFLCVQLVLLCVWEWVQPQEASSTIAVNIVGCVFLFAVYAMLGCFGGVRVCSVISAPTLEARGCVAYFVSK